MGKVRNNGQEINVANTSFQRSVGKCLKLDVCKPEYFAILAEEN